MRFIEVCCGDVGEGMTNQKVVVHQRKVVVDVAAVMVYSTQVDCCLCLHYKGIVSMLVKRFERKGHSRFEAPLDVV